MDLRAGELIRLRVERKDETGLAGLYDERNMKSIYRENKDKEMITGPESKGGNRGKMGLDKFSMIKCHEEERKIKEK